MGAVTVRFGAEHFSANRCYSYLNASMGLRREALLAG